ncbi:hypothetical protein GCM10028801_46420 [Nocardioides maradonensis]
MVKKRQVRGHHVWLMVSLGLPVQFVVSQPSADVLRSFGACDDFIASAAATYFGRRLVHSPLVAKVSGESILVSVHDIERMPLWPLSPVFYGKVHASGSASCVITGVIRARRTTQAGLLLVILALALIGGSPAHVFIALIIGGYILETIFVLPRTSQRLESGLRTFVVGV